MATPVIIEAAINGVTAPERNPSVPRSPAEIAADAVRCLAAGAAIVHSHNAEFALDGARAAGLYLEAWRPVLRERPDAIFYPTAGAGTTIAERYAHEVLLAEAGVLRMGLVDPGSVNLGGADEHGLPLPIDYVYVNSYRDILYQFELCARHRLGPSISMLEGCDLPWSVAVLGGDVVASGLARLALERGGHLRIGLEDHAGPRCPTNEELVREAAALVRATGRRVATCAEAARILGLPQEAS